MARHYPAIVEADGDSVFFPDVPGCASGGATLQEAALRAHPELAVGHDEAVPDLSDLGSAAVEADVRTAARLLARAEIDAEPVRVNVMLPGDLLATVDRHAERCGYTRSALLAQAVRDRMHRDRGL